MRGACYRRARRKPLTAFAIALGPGVQREPFERAARRLVVRPWQTLEIRHGDGLSLAWTDSGDAGCAVETPDGFALLLGHLHGAVHRREVLRELLARVAADDALNTFRALSGRYMVLVWRGVTLQLSNSIMGTVPAYVRRGRHPLLISSEQRFLVEFADPGFDHEGLLRRLRFRSSYGPSLLAGVARLDADVVIRATAGGGWRQQRLGRHGRDERWAGASEAEVVSQLHRAFGASYPALRGRALGVSLSGGLDSRLTLAALGALTEPDKVHAATFVVPYDEEAPWVRGVVRAARPQHLLFPLQATRGRELEQVESFVETFEEIAYPDSLFYPLYVDMLHTVGVPFFESLICETLLSCAPEAAGPYSPARNFLLARQTGIRIEDLHADPALEHVVAEEVEDTYRSLAAELSPQQRFQLFHALTYSFLARALDLAGQMRTLYEHNGVVALLLGCNPALLRDHRLYHAYLARHCPRLAGLPSSRGVETPRTALWRKLSRSFHQEWVVNQAAGVLRDYVADQRALLRPYLTDAFLALVVRSLERRQRIGKFQGALLGRLGARVLVPQDLMIPVNLVALLRTLRRGVPPRARPARVRRGTFRVATIARTPSTCCPIPQPRGPLDRR